jgi:hypothetical protein
MLGVGMSLYDSEEDNGGLWGAMAAGLTFGELPETVSVPFVGIVAADGFGSVIELLSGSDLSANDITFYMGEMRSSDWNADGKISGSFYGIFLQGTFEAGVNLGRLNGSFTGNSEYVELGEELNGQMWTAAMAGEWVEVDELLSLTELTSRVEEMSDMNIVTICDQAAIPGTGYGGLTTGTMDIGMYAMNESALTGIWAAFFSGAYDTGAAIGTTDWGMDFVTENANVALEGMQWNIIDETVGNGEWLATVSGQVDGNMIAGTAAGTFDGAGAFAGAGAGAWAAPEVVNAVETVVDPVAPDVN